jgi:hypothetical protein
VIDLRTVRGLAITVVTVAACGGGGGGGPAETPVEARLRAAIAGAVGAPVARVKCATPIGCVATIEGVEVKVAVREEAGSGSGGGKLAWDIDGLVVRAATLEAEVAALLGELEVTAKVDCGARVQIVKRQSGGGRITCGITSAARGGAPVAEVGQALATIDADGAAEIELVLGAEAVKARTEEVGTAVLETMSRSLDTAEAQGEDGEGSGSGSAGASGLGPRAPGP